MDNTPDVSHPCGDCSRDTCRRCGEVEDTEHRPPVAADPVVWAPWMAAQAANA